MPYATLADLTTRYGEDEIRQRSDHAGIGSIDTAVVNQALADASAEIDAYLSGRFTLPLATVPPHLVRICCAIARYRLWDDAMPERVRVEYQDAVRLLESIAKGMVTLGLSIEPVSGLSEARPGDDRVFSRSGTGGY
jgi:phage gp36-like protein